MWNLLAFIGLGIASFLGIWSPPVVETPVVAPPVAVVEERSPRADAFLQEMRNIIDNYVKQAFTENFSFGADAVLPIAGATYNLSGSGVSSSASSITLSSLTLPQSGQKLLDADFSTTFYITLEPGNRTRQEIASCTTVVQNAAGTATLSGCSRGLSPITPYTSSTTLQFAHGGGTQVIFSDPPQLFNEAIFRDNNATSTATHTWSSTTPPRYDYVPANHATGAIVSTTSEFASMAALSAVVASGCLDAAEGNQGCVELATGAEAASSTSSGSEARLVIPASRATSSPYTHSGSGNTYAVITEDDGYIAEGFIDYSQNITRTGTVTHSATTSLSAMTAIATSSPSYLAGLNVGTSTYFSKAVGIGVATSSSSANLEIAGNLIVSGRASTTAYSYGYSQVTNTGALSTAITNVTTVTATCPAGTEVLSGGYSGIPPSTSSNETYTMNSSYPASASTWTVAVSCDNTNETSSLACEAGTLTVYAVCADVRF